LLTGRIAPPRWLRNTKSAGPLFVRRAQWANSYVATRNGASVTFTGDGVERYLSDFAAVPNGSLYHQSVPSVHAALSMGAERPSDEVVVPLYLRDADAVANFTTRERPQ